MTTTSKHIFLTATIIEAAKTAFKIILFFLKVRNKNKIEFVFLTFGSVCIVFPKIMYIF